MIATRTKTKKIAESWPPAEIREVTKPRRAWLAAETARVLETPNRSVKLVGVGSYQHLSVYEVTTVEGRVRHRGHCQCCGGLQVVEAGRMVLHGYERPGEGFIVGRCPGVNEPPMEISMTRTYAWKKSAEIVVAETMVEIERAKATLVAARAVWAEAGYPSGELKPRRPSRETAETVAAWTAAHAAWEAANPIHAAIARAEAEETRLEHLRWIYTQQVRHYEFWIAENPLGQPLVEEVVA